MMRLWLSRNAAESLREQLVTQIRLGVLSGELPPGERLPSVRDLGRRYKVHANTVSAAYRELELLGLLTFRKGSGVYVSDVRAPREAQPSSKLDALAAEFVRQAREQGYSTEEARAAVTRVTRSAAIKRVLLAEPEPELCQVLAAELDGQVGLPVTAHVLRDDLTSKDVAGATVTALMSRSAVLQSALPVGAHHHLLRLRSVAEHFAGAQLPTERALIGVASSSPEILRRARTLLSAVGVDADALEFRDARESGWSRGLNACAFVIADVVTAKRLPKGCAARVLRVLSDASIEELRKSVNAPGS
jgi:GntR family transcriptional regulator